MWQMGDVTASEFTEDDQEQASYRANQGIGGCVTPLTWPTQISTSHLRVKIVNLTFEQIKYGMCLLTPCT